MRLGPKLIVAFLVLSLGPLAAASGYAYATARESLEQQAVSQLESLANAQDERVEAIVRQHLERHAFVADRLRIAEAVDRGDADELTVILAELLDLHPSLHHASLVRPDGAVLASAGEATGSTPVDPAASRLEPLLAEDDDTIVVRTTGPLRRSAEPAFLVLEADGQEIVEATADYRGLGRTGETILVLQRRDAPAVYMTPLRYDPEATLRRSVPGEVVASRAALSGEERTYQDILDYRGNRTIAATRTVEPVGWGLVVKIDVDEAFAPAGALARSLAVFFVGTAVISGLVGVYLARSITRPIDRLTATTRRISEGDLTLRTRERSADEIGELGASFDRMAANLIEANQHLEEKVRARTAELERSNAELQQFAYVASHDLQEPLRMVASYTQLLERRYKGQLGPEADEFIAYAVDGAKRMQGLINDLLEYSRLDTREGTLKPVDMTKAFDTARTNLEGAVRDSGATVTKGTLPVVRADPTQMVQLLQNLIGNAIKFRGAEPPRVHVDAERDREMWIVTVRDNGIGIELEHQERIFQIFQRLHGRSQYSGTGIGLAICKKIVERQGGRIWVESRSGAGSAFRFTLPAEDEGDGAHSPPAASAAEAPASSRK